MRVIVQMILKNLIKIATKCSIRRRAIIVSPNYAEFSHSESTMNKMYNDILHHFNLFV